MSLVDQSGAPLAPQKTAYVAICVPSQDSVAASFAYDLARLIGHTSTVRPDIALQLTFNKGTLLVMQRHELVKQALASNATHILWLDSDMRFPKDALVRLLEHAKPLVAVNYPRRRFPQLPTAATEQGFVFIPPGAEGLEEVETAGMGVMLMTTALFREMPQPWFSIGWSRKRECYVGEDVTLCNMARSQGVPILIDCMLSNEIAHLGEMEFRNAHSLAVRESLLAEEAASHGT